jgi:tetraacyldisaccharide 4'-kinase
LPSAAASLPVISIGNLTVGGAGKTPLVLHLASRLLDAGVPVGVLSRGYRRTDSRPLVLEPRAPLPDSSRIGDEPWLLRRRLPDLALGIDASRRRAAREIAPCLPGGVLLLDDGFQHRQLRRQLDLVVVALGEPLAEGRLLPAGRLRESPVALRRADHLLVMTASPSPDPQLLEATRRALARLAPGCPIGVARARIAGARPLGAADDPLVPLSTIDGPVVALAGIARPERLVRALEAAGVEVGERCFFPDHHRFRPGDHENIASAAGGVGTILTTEKDEPRLLETILASERSIAGVPVMVAPLDLEFSEGESELLAAVGTVAGVAIQRRRD